MSKHIEVKFTVKETANGQPFLFSEPLTASAVPAVSLMLKNHISIEQAQEIAQVLNANLMGISIG